MSYGGRAEQRKQAPPCFIVFTGLIGLIGVIAMDVLHFNGAADSFAARTAENKQPPLDNRLFDIPGTRRAAKSARRREFPL